MMNSNHKTRKGTSSTLIPDMGKVPPQAMDMEEAVLGAMLLEKDAVLKVIEILKPESFYRESHQKIFKTMIELAKRNHPVDLFTVSEDLRAHNELDSIGGPLYITQLSSKIVSAANVEYHASIIAQKYIQRELIRMSLELQNRAFDDTYDITDLLEYAEVNLLEVSGKIFRKKATRIGIIVDRVIDTIAKIKNGEIKLVGVPSGFTMLDRATAGFKKQELTIIAGRPSMGKTALAAQIAKNAALMKNPVAFFSLEMSEDELGRRYLSGSSGRTNIELLNGKCDLDQLCTSSQELVSLPIYIDDTSAISLVELRAKVRRMILEYGIKLVIVDYLGLMRGEGDTREQEVSSISRGLKSIAKDLDIPVVALSQLNRRLESSVDKRPTLSDLRDSGSIEQDADIVHFVYRPEKYGIESLDGVSTKGLMLVIIGKNRNGPIGDIRVKCSPSLSRIFDENEEDPSGSEIPIMPNKSFDEEPPFAVT